MVSFKNSACFMAGTVWQDSMLGVAPRLLYGSHGMAAW